MTNLYAFLHHESIRTVFWGELGPEEFRETGLTAVHHTRIFLAPAELQNETDRDSDKCTRRTGNLVSVTGLLVSWGGSKGKLL